MRTTNLISFWSTIYCIIAISRRRLSRESLSSRDLLPATAPMYRILFCASVRIAMIDSELLEILCCPETKQPVTLVEGEAIERINEKIAAGSVKNRGGEAVEEKIDAGLLREDKKYLYPIRDDIPIMLEDEAIPFDES